MDGRIDVVAVFRGLWEDMPAEGKRELAAAQEVDAAIDAVVELIEAAKNATHYIEAIYAPETDALNRLEAAIAKVGAP